MKARTSHVIISVCYAFIIGIVADMVFPMPPLLIASAWSAAALFTLGGIAWWRLNAHKTTHKIVWWPILLCIAAFIFGYVRHAQVNTIPDRKVGTITVDAYGTASYEGVQQFNSPVRLRLVKRTEGHPDLKLQLSGMATVLSAVTNEQGRARIDADERWLMTEVTTPVQSDIIEVTGDTLWGTVYAIPQPFSMIERVNCIGRGPCTFDVYSVSSHASSFARAGRFRPAVTVLGRVAEDPHVYETRAKIRITPAFIQYVQGGPYYAIEGGDVQVLLHDTDEAFKTFAATEAYGYHVQAKGELRTPLGPPNPGGFDQRTYLNNHSIFGTLFISRGATGADGMVAVPLPGDVYAHGNALVEFSLNLRDKMAAIIKQTLPMPHSSFIGAITLGMRYSFANVPSLFSDYYDKRAQGMSTQEYRDGDFVHTGTELTIADEFKRAGTNHVLAVSGLHVTIITAMCVGIFMLLRIPRKMFVPITIFALVIFAIITGARPSTLRAVIMNSLFLLTWAYLARSFRSAALFGVAVAGFLILVDNPLMIVDPSFTLSFGAILSLVLMTGPFYAVLCRLRGNMFIAAFIFLAVTTIVAIRAIYVFYDINFWLLYCGFWFAVFIAVHYVSNKIGNITSLGFQDIPPKVGGFFAAQFAIQVGMMVPLSAYYFAQWPIGGAYANILAIPLVGIVLQLGLIAGLIGLIPVVGVFVALFLNAANWALSTIFLYISHIVAVAFPYPFVPRPSIAMLIAYYAVCFIFIYHAPLERLFTQLLQRFKIAGKWYPRICSIALACVLLLSAYGIGVVKTDDAEGKMQMTSLAVRYGSAICIQTPNGNTLLCDAGAVNYGDRTFNNTDREILPFLARKGFLHINALIMTAPGVQRSGGIPYIIDALPVDSVFVPPGVYGVHSDIKEQEEIPAAYDGDEAAWKRRVFHVLAGNWRWPQRTSLISALRNREDNIISRMFSSTPEVKELQQGTVVWQEKDAKGVPFTVRCIHTAPASDSSGTAASIEIVYGDTRVLIPSDMHLDELPEMQQSAGGEAEILFMPSHGVLIARDAREIDKEHTRILEQKLLPFITAFSPEYIVNEYGDPKYVRPEMYRIMRSAHDVTRQFIEKNISDSRYVSTDTDQAIIITSDGRDVAVTTQVEMLGDAGSATGEGTADIGYAF